MHMHMHMQHAHAHACMVCRQARLVEVNTNGYMIGNLHKDFFALHDEQRAIMKLMGASGYPRYAVSGGTE